MQRARPSLPPSLAPYSCSESEKEAARSALFLDLVMRELEFGFRFKIPEDSMLKDAAYPIERRVNAGRKPSPELGLVRDLMDGGGVRQTDIGPINKNNVDMDEFPVITKLKAKAEAKAFKKPNIVTGAKGRLCKLL